MISRSEDIRTDIGVGVNISAGAVVGEFREVTAVDRREVALDDALATLFVFTEPSGVSGSTARDTRNVRVGTVGIGLGVLDGSFEVRLLFG